MAALADDSIVGTDDPDDPLSQAALAACVSQPDIMRFVVKHRFKFRASNKKLDDDTLQTLCSKAIGTLRISECSQDEPALGVASVITPLTACWCVPARLPVRRCGVLATVLSP